MTQNIRKIRQADESGVIILKIWSYPEENVKMKGVAVVLFYTRVSFSGSGLEFLPKVSHAYYSLPLADQSSPLSTKSPKFSNLRKKKSTNWSNGRL